MPRPDGPFSLPFPLAGALDLSPSPLLEFGQNIFMCLEQKDTSTKLYMWHDDNSGDPSPLKGPRGKAHGDSAFVLSWNCEPTNL